MPRRTEDDRKFNLARWERRSPDLPEERRGKVEERDACKRERTPCWVVKTHPPRRNLPGELI